VTKEEKIKKLESDIEVKEYLLKIYESSEFMSDKKLIPFVKKDIDECNKQINEMNCMDTKSFEDILKGVKDDTNISNVSKIKTVEDKVEERDYSLKCIIFSGNDSTVESDFNDFFKENDVEVIDIDSHSAAEFRLRIVVYYKHKYSMDLDRTKKILESIRNGMDNTNDSIDKRNDTFEDRIRNTFLYE
jgi:hypothetical protein